MPRTALIIDFGSTYTKLRAIDLDRAEVIGSGQGPSTVTTDINHGLDLALSDLKDRLGGLPTFEYRLASSSAAGGLGMVTIGLVPKLTAEAARHAALGAGAKILSNYSYELTDADVREIECLNADILLLSGGTDGGNKAVYLANAAALARSSVACPFVLAGNRSASDQVAEILKSGGKSTVTTENVMPEYLKLNIEPAREAIRKLFIEHIVHAKGIDRAADRFDEILMPTPAAVLAAATLLADGTEKSEGLGPLIVLDVGGATTDVHSVCDGSPTDPSVTMLGLEEPYAKRSVEGDLGMRHAAKDIVNAVGASEFARLAEMDEGRVAALLSRCEADVDWLPETPEENSFDMALSQTAVRLSIQRHAGRQTLVQTVHGPTTVQRGKDLGRVATVIGTGGVLAHGGAPLSALSGAVRACAEAGALGPRSAKFYLDANYTLFACGLLGGREPDVALRLAKKSMDPLFEELGNGVFVG